METFQALLANKLSDALARVGLPKVGELTPATDPRFGDYQTNAALVLGKQRGESPKTLAGKILASLDAGDICEPPIVAGAGFVNFTLRTNERQAIRRFGKRAARNWSSCKPATGKTSIFGTSVSPSRCRISSRFTNCSTSITTSSAERVSITIACQRPLIACSNPASRKSVKAQSAFSFAIFPS